MGKQYFRNMLDIWNVVKNQTAEAKEHGIIAANFGGEKPRVKVFQARKGKKELVFGSDGLQCYKYSVLPFWR